MADFPSYAHCPYTQDSQDEILDDLRIDEADDGTVRSRAFYAAPKHRFTLQFRITKDEYTTYLLPHYTGNRTANFNFTWAVDGVTYVCRYEKAGPTIKFRGGPMLDVTVVLRSE